MLAGARYRSTACAAWLVLVCSATMLAQQDPSTDDALTRHLAALRDPATADAAAAAILALPPAERPADRLLAALDATGDASPDAVAHARRVGRVVGTALAGASSGPSGGALVARLPAVGASIALGALGDDRHLPDLVARLEDTRRPARIVALAEACCDLGGTVGVDVLLSVALRPGGEEIRDAIAALKRCVNDSITVPDKVTNDRSGPFHVRQHWDADPVRRLRVGPAEPSEPLLARIDALASRLADRSDDDPRARFILTGLRGPGAAAICDTFRTDDPRPTVARRQRVLLDIGASAVPALRTALAEPDGRAAVLRALVWLTTKAHESQALQIALPSIEPIVLALWPTLDPASRLEAIRYLGQIGSPLAGERLVAHATDPSADADSRRAAAAAAALLPGDAASLIALARDAAAPPAVRDHAAYAAAARGAREGLGLLVDALATRATPLPLLRAIDGRPYFGYEQHPDRALERWRRYRDRFAKAARYTVPRLHTESRWAIENEAYAEDLRDGWYGVLTSAHPIAERVTREDAILSMADQTAPTLAAWIERATDPVRRFHAVQIASIRGLRPLVPSLVSALGDDVALIRSTAAEGLGLIGQGFEYADYAAAIADALRPRLADPDGFVRGQVALALARVGSAEGVPTLIDALLDDDRAVSDFAWATLRRITDGRDGGFIPGSGLAARRAAVASLRDWWRAAGDTFRPTPPPPKG